MPVFQQRLAVAARDLKAFLNLKLGLARATPGPAPAGDSDRQLQEVRRELAEKNRELVRLRARSDGRAGGVRPENVVWIFGSGRSGSTWLSSMMGDVEGHALWGEPWVGALFGNYYYRTVDERRREAVQFIMGPHKETWLGSIRRFVLDGADALFPGLTEEAYLIIKEPNGTIGAPLLMEAMPESRMIFLVRDPRDVVASSKDAKSEAGFNFANNRQEYLKGRKTSSDKDPNAFVKGRARRYLEGIGKAKEAYDAHEGHKVMVRYEELRPDTYETMRRIYSELDISVPDSEISRVVEKHSWEAIPAEQKGPGKFYRKATPGSWREDLSPEQARTVEEITAPLLEVLYPELTVGR